MKRVFAYCLLAVFLTGCTTMERLDSAVNRVEKLIDGGPDAAAIATTVPEGGLLTKEEAEQIALDHSGFRRDQVRQLKTEYDFDNGKHRYEVEFRQGTREYSYEIDGETGKILDYEWEM